MALSYDRTTSGLAGPGYPGNFSPAMLKYQGAKTVLPDSTCKLEVSAIKELPGPKDASFSR
jgi:hypothetical protein